MTKYGDCCSWLMTTCRSDSSNIASPVALAKSATVTRSVSANVGARWQAADAATAAADTRTYKRVRVMWRDYMEARADVRASLETAAAAEAVPGPPRQAPGGGRGADRGVPRSGDGRLRLPGAPEPRRCVPECRDAA